MYKGNKGHSLLDRCIALLLTLVLSVSLVDANVIVGLADDHHHATHQHTFACYDDYWTTCGLDDSDAHVHTYDCYATYGEPACGFEEGDEDEHRHNHDGFICDIVGQVAACGYEEHQHTAECYATVDAPSVANDTMAALSDTDLILDSIDLQQLLDDTMQAEEDQERHDAYIASLQDSSLPQTGLIQSDSTIGTTSISLEGMPICGVLEHTHTDECIVDVYSCRLDYSNIMTLGEVSGTGDYVAGLVWNINDSTMIPRDSTKTFVTWKNDSSATISAIATVSLTSNKTVAAGGVTITLPSYLYLDRNGSKNGTLDQDSLRKTLAKTGFGISKSQSDKVTVSNTGTMPASTSVTFDIVYKIDVLATKDKTEFNSLTAEFQLGTDIRTYTLGGQIDSGIRSFSATARADSEFKNSYKGRHYYYSTYLENNYGITAAQFADWEARGYILVEHYVTASTPVKNQLCNYSVVISPGNQGKLAATTASWRQYTVVESRQGSDYVYTIDTKHDFNVSSWVTSDSTLGVIIAYPRNASASSSDANQASVSCNFVFKLDGVDGEDSKIANVRVAHSSIMNKGTYEGHKFAQGHSISSTSSTEGALRVLAGGKDVNMSFATSCFADYRTEYKAGQGEFHTVELFNDNLYLSTTGTQPYKLGAGDISYKTLYFHRMGDGEPMLLPSDTAGVGFAVQGIVDDTNAHRSDGGAWSIYVLTPESPNQWVYDGQIAYEPNYVGTYTIKHDKAFAWKVSFNKAIYFTTMAVESSAEIHGSSSGLANVVNNALRAGATSLDLASWSGMAAYPTTSGWTNQECFTSFASLSGDTVPLVRSWDLTFWSKYGFTLTGDKSIFRIGKTTTFTTTTVDSTMRQSVGVRKSSSSVVYGDAAKNVAVNAIAIDVDGGFLLHGTYGSTTGPALLETFKGGNNAFDSVMVNFYTLLPKGFEFKSAESKSPHRVTDSNPSVFGPLSNVGTNYVYANRDDSFAVPSVGVVSTQVTRNYKGSGQIMVKTTVRYPTALLSRFSDTKGNYYGSLFPLHIESDYIFGSAPTGTYYVYTAMEFLDGEGYPYDLSSLTGNNVFVDNGSVFSGESVQSVFSGVGSAKRPGHAGAPSIMGIRSSFTTGVSATVTGGSILTRTDSNPGWNASVKAEINDQYYYRMTFADQAGSSDGVVLITALDGGTSSNTSTFQGHMIGIDLSVCEDLAINPKVYVNKDYIDKSKYLSSTSRPTGVTAADLAAGYDNWVYVDYKTFTQWSEVKSIAIYFDKAGTSNGYVFDAQAGIAIVDITMEQPGGKLRPGSELTAYTELLVHANHIAAKENTTSLANDVSVTVDTSYSMGINEYIAGPGWTSEWPNLYTTTTTYPGDDYAYRINFNVNSGSLTDVVLFDSLEDEFDTEWTGTLLGLARVTSQSSRFPMDEGAKLYVNYSNIDKSEYVENAYGPSYLNDAANGWMLVQNPAAYEDWGKVKSVALALGSNIYSRGDSVSFILRMKAPTKGFKMNTAMYTTDTSFVTAKVLYTDGRVAEQSHKVSAKVDIQATAGIYKTSAGTHYDSDGTPIKGSSAAGDAKKVGPGLPYTYTITGSRANDSLGNYVIVDDVLNGSFDGSTFESIDAGWISTGETEMVPAANTRMWVYIGDGDVSSATFWEGINYRSLVKGVAGWYPLSAGETVTTDYKSKVKAIAATSDSPLYSADGNFVVYVTMRAPSEGLSTGTTYKAIDTARVIFSTPKGEDDFEVPSNPADVHMSSKAGMSIDVTITPRNLDGTWGEASGYSAPVYPTKEYLYTTAASFTGTAYNPMVYGTLERSQPWQGKLMSVDAFATNISDATTGEMLEVSVYLSKSSDKDLFEDISASALMSGKLKTWVRLDDIPEEELGDYRSWVAMIYNGVACEASQLVIRTIMETPQYGAYGAIANTADGKYTVLGTDDTSVVKGRTVYPIPSEVYVNIDKYTTYTKGGAEENVSSGIPDKDGNMLDSGMSPFYYALSVTPRFETDHKYGFVKDLFVEDRLRDIPNSSDRIAEVVYEVDASSIPEDVPITAYVGISDYATENLVAKGVTIDEVSAIFESKDFVKITRSEFSSFDWSVAKHIVFYFGSDSGVYDWEITETTSAMTVYIGVTRDYAEFEDDGSNGFNSFETVANRAVLSANSAKPQIDEDTVDYKVGIPSPDIEKHVCNYDRDAATYSTFVDIARGDSYEYEVTLKSIEGNGATDYILFDSLENLEDTTAHGQPLKIDINEFISAGIPVTVYGNDYRLSADELQSITLQDLTDPNGDWFEIKMENGANKYGISGWETFAFYLGTVKDGSWVDDGRTIPENGLSAYIRMGSSNMFADAEEGIFNKVYIARNMPYVRYAVGGIRGFVPGSVAGVNYYHTAEDDLSSEFSKTVSSSFGGDTSGMYAETPYNGTYQYDLDYTLKQGAVDVAIGDTIENPSDAESGWNGTLQGIDISSLTNAGYDPEVWVSTEAISDWGEVFGDPVSTPGSEVTYNLSLYGSTISSDFDKVGVRTYGYNGNRYVKYNENIAVRVGSAPSVLCLGINNYYEVGYLSIRGNTGSQYSFVVPEDCHVYYYSNVTGETFTEVHPDKGLVRGTLPKNNCGFVNFIICCPVDMPSGVKVGDKLDVKMSILTPSGKISAEKRNIIEIVDHDYSYFGTCYCCHNTPPVVAPTIYSTSPSSSYLPIACDTTKQQDVSWVTTVRVSGTPGESYTFSVPTGSPIEALDGGSSLNAGVSTVKSITKTMDSNGNTILYARVKYALRSGGTPGTTKTLDVSATGALLCSYGSVATERVSIASGVNLNNDVEYKAHAWFNSTTQHECKRCGDVGNHTWASAEDGKHTCTECGYSATHSYTKTATSHSCSLCGLSEDHTFYNASSTRHKCSICSYVGDHVLVAKDKGTHACTSCSYTQACTYPKGNYGSPCSVGSFNGAFDGSSVTSKYTLEREASCRYCASACPHDFSYGKNGVYYCVRCGAPELYVESVKVSGSVAVIRLKALSDIVTATVYSLVNYKATGTQYSISNNFSDITVPLVSGIQELYITTPSGTTGASSCPFTVSFSSGRYFCSWCNTPWNDSVQLGSTLMLSVDDTELAQATVFEASTTDDQTGSSAITIIDPWAGHDLSKFVQVPLEQLDTYDWSKVKSIAIRFTRYDEHWDATDYFPMDADEEPMSVNVKLFMKAPKDAEGTTGDLAYNRAVFWELSGKDFSHQATATPITTVRLLGWSAMPNTGGSGLAPFYQIGGLSMIALGAWLTYSKKKRANCRADRRNAA